jgi:hypothetical protein
MTEKMAGVGDILKRQDFASAFLRPWIGAECDPPLRAESVEAVKTH